MCDGNPFVNDLAQFPINFNFVVAMAARPNDPWTLADKCLIFIGPFNNFQVSSRFGHFVESAIAGLKK